MIPLLQTKTADTAHTGIFASNTRPLSRFLGGVWGRGYSRGGWKLVISGKRSRNYSYVNDVIIRAAIQAHSER